MNSLKIRWKLISMYIPVACTRSIKVTKYQLFYVEFRIYQELKCDVGYVVYHLLPSVRHLNWCSIL